MQFELRSKNFYKKTGRLMAPVALQQLITVGINFLDNLMIGGFGETQIAAASFGNQFYSLFQFICMGLGSGAVVLSSQFWGRRELEPMRRVAAIALRLTAAFCLALTLVTALFPQVILRAFTHDAPVIAVGTPYMRLIGLTFLLAGLTSTATYLLRSVGNVRIPLIGSAGAFFLNLFFNWVFIFGKLGAPRLELVGAAVGTVIARAFEFCFVFGYFMLRDTRFRFRPRQFFLAGGELWRPYLKYGIPVLVSDALLGVSVTLISVITGHMGEEVATASSIVNTLSQLTNVLSMAIAGAAAIVVGNTIGQGDIPRAKRESNSYIVLALLLGLIVMVPLLLLEGPYFNMYTIKAHTRAVAHGMLLVNALSMPLQTLSNAVSKGILRGGGDTRFLLVADSGGLWLISLPLGALAAYVWHMDAVWVYLFLMIQYPLKGIICWIRYATGRWVKVITANGVSAGKEQDG